jgi:hypothetical protein
MTSDFSLEAITGTAMRKIGLVQPDYIDERAAGTGQARVFRSAAGQH